MIANINIALDNTFQQLLYKDINKYYALFDQDKNLNENISDTSDLIYFNGKP